MVIKSKDLHLFQKISPYKAKNLVTHLKIISICHSRAGGNPIIVMKSYLYILASNFNGTLYIGVTSDLIKRVWQHKEKFIEGFSKKYNVSKLVYFEEFSDIKQAISREKQIKKWNRQWKINLIEKSNLVWKDLYNEIIQ